MTFKHEWLSPIGTLRLFKRNEALSGLYFEEHSPAPRSEEGIRDAAAFKREIGQLEEYFAGQRIEFDLPITFEGTGFQSEVWQALRSIPFGTTTSYGTIADTCGRSNAVRAVGAAVGRNPISIIIPCHRVVGASGKLTGFAGGLSRKKHLLELEQTAQHAGM